MSSKMKSLSHGCWTRILMCYFNDLKGTDLMQPRQKCQTFRKPRKYHHHITYFCRNCCPFPHASTDRHTLNDLFQAEHFATFPAGRDLPHPLPPFGSPADEGTFHESAVSLSSIDRFKDRLHHESLDMEAI